MPQSQNALSPLLSGDEFERLTGVTKSTQAKWRMLGRGCKFVRLGRKVAYRTQDVEQWLVDNLHRSTSDQ